METYYKITRANKTLPFLFTTHEVAQKSLILSTSKVPETRPEYSIEKTTHNGSPICNTPEHL